MLITEESLKITQSISEKIENLTFHHHYHILYDIAKTFPDDYKLTYVEIGCYGGGSACLMLQIKNIQVISIDLGYPIDPSIVKQNVKNLNIHNNDYYYILGNSQEQETINKLKNLIKDQKIDILFIDGDHTFNGVLSDFSNYEKFVSENGYIVFDDYNDKEHSPEVKSAVDSIDFKNYEFIGVFGSEFGARPNIGVGNEYVIKKIK